MASFRRRMIFCLDFRNRIDDGPPRVTPAGCDRMEENAAPAATPARRTRATQAGAAVVSLATDRLQAAPIIQRAASAKSPTFGGSIIASRM